MAVTIIENIECNPVTQPVADGGIVPPRIRTRLGGLGGNGDGNGVPIDRSRFEESGGPLDNITDREQDGILMLALDGLENLPGLDEVLEKYGHIIAPPGPPVPPERMQAFLSDLRKRGVIKRPSLIKRILRFLPVDRFGGM